MKIMSFISSLLPSFDRQRVISNIASLQSELGGSVIKVAAEASELIGKKKFTSEFNKELDKRFHQATRSFRSADVVQAISNVLESLPGKLGYLEGLVSANFAKDVARDALSYQKASVLKYIEVTEFFSNYAERLLLKIMEAETCALNGTEATFGQNSSPALHKWMDAHERDFFKVMDALALPLKDVKDKIDAIPDITAIPDNVDTVQETVGAAKLDPLGLGFLITTWFNPLYRVRMNFAEWQVKRYHAKQELVQALQFRLLALREAYAKKQDPRLEKSINYHEGRINDLTRELAETEADYMA